MLGKEIQVSIIVLNYNKWEYLFPCLESIFTLQNISYQIIIVDNASENDSVSRIFSYFNCQQNISKETFIYQTIPVNIFRIRSTKYIYDVILLQASTNKGFAFGNNIGLSYASSHISSNYYWLLSNDTIVDSKALIQLHKAAEYNKKIGLWGSVLLEYEKDTIQAIAGKYNIITGLSGLLLTGKKYSVLCSSPEISENIGFPIGASLFISRDFLMNVGYLNETYYLYYEELDWVYRAKKQGYKCAIANKSLVYHKGGATISQKSKLSDLIGLRSKMLFTKKYLPLTLPFAYIHFIFFIINRIRRMQFDRIIPAVKIILNPNISVDTIILISNI